VAGYNIHTFSLSVVQIGHTPCSLPTWYNWHTPLNSLWHWRWRQLLLRTVGVYIVIHGIKIQVIVMRSKSVVEAENCYKFPPPFFFWYSTECIMQDFSVVLYVLYDLLTNTSNDVWLFMIYACEKYCIISEHTSFKRLHYISMLWLLLL